jgi:AcrR family transcriptional regulator
MPRFVDAESRREEILAAAYALVEEDGLHGVSFRTVAARMGGSPTLVTHYYGSREELVDALLGFAMDRWKDELDSLETGIEDPLERLRALLGWFVPAAHEIAREEGARLNLLANHDHDEETREMLKEWDRLGRALVRRYLRPLVSDAERERIVEILRVTTYGITLSALQDPASWPKQRQLEMIDIQLRLLGLADPGPGVKSTI